VAFHIAILYDIYLPGGGGQKTWTGGWVHWHILKWPARCVVCGYVHQ